MLAVENFLLAVANTLEENCFSPHKRQSDYHTCFHQLRKLGKYYSCNLLNLFLNPNPLPFLFFLESYTQISLFTIICLLPSPVASVIGIK